MVFDGENCGYRSVEVKQGGEITEKGRNVTLKVKNGEDLKRDLYKGDNCSINIPEVDLYLVQEHLEEYINSWWVDLGYPW